MIQSLLAPLITIDGPSGSGKGTIGRLLAHALGWHFLDSGALYRALAWLMRQKQISPENTEQLEKVVNQMRLEFNFLKDAKVQISLNDEDVTHILPTEACGNDASRIGAVPHIRQLLLEKQRAFREPPGLIADGRDMGTVIFPDAELKVFLSASPEIRSERRHFQLKAQGINVSLSDIKAELQVRDERDKTRSTAPLIPAPDAILLDTTSMSVSDVLEFMRPFLLERFGFKGSLS